MAGAGESGRPSFRRRLKRLTESGNLVWSAAAFVISLIALLPILAIAVIALKPSGDTWPHLIENVLPGALRRTLLQGLARRSGVRLPEPLASVGPDPYDRFADAVGASVDVPRVFALCGLPAKEQVR